MGCAACWQLRLADAGSQLDLQADINQCMHLYACMWCAALFSLLDVLLACTAWATGACSRTCARHRALTSKARSSSKLCSMQVHVYVQVQVRT